MQYLQYLMQKASIHLYYWTFSGSHQIWNQMSGISLCNQGRLLFHNDVHFFKKNVEPEINVLIACYDGQEVSELVDYYVLNQLKTVIRKEFFGFYRDDDLCIIKIISETEVKWKRKHIVTVFKGTSTGIWKTVSRKVLFMW